jgi:hypothetical protein
VPRGHQPVDHRPAICPSPMKPISNVPPGGPGLGIVHRTTHSALGPGQTPATCGREDD